MSDFILTEAQSKFVDLHVLYQVETGNADSGEPFTLWVRSADTSDPIGTAIDLITEQVAPDTEDLTITQAKRITWLLAEKVRAAVSAVRMMESGGAS